MPLSIDGADVKVIAGVATVVAGLLVIVGGLFMQSIPMVTVGAGLLGAPGVVTVAAHEKTTQAATVLVHKEGASDGEPAT